MTPDRWPAPRTIATWLAALLSGGAALAYEIAWSRALVVPLGNSTDASALVLAAFMIGIGAGALLAGRIAERASHPLRVYAVAEVLLGLYALAAPSLLGSLSNVGVAGLRGVGALVLIAIPCLAMGASLPLLVRALTRPGTSLDVQVGLAYGANTAGAAIGAICTGFWGLAAHGTARWSAMAAIASFAAAGIAWIASEKREPETTSPPEPAGRAMQRLALIGTFTIGFVVLACEVLWARLLTFVFGHDTYAFATLLATVLVGLSMGGLLHRMVARRNQRSLFAILLAGYSLVTLVSFWVATVLVIRFGRDPFDLQASGTFATSIRLELYRELAFTPILLLVPSILAGMAFPAACATYASGSRDAGRSVGVIALVNGLGAACGAAVAALGIVSLLGIQPALLTLMALPCIAAAALLIQRLTLRNTAIALATALPAVFVALFMPAELPRSMLLASVGPRHQVLLHYEEARTGTVSVIRNEINGERQLLMNAVNEVTTRLVHNQSFKVLGHLAPLLHPNPKRGVMICLGAGLSAGAALTHPLDRLDVIDLSSAVARGARYFHVENNGVLDDPRLRLHIDDGRQFLLNTGERYDIAIVDSTHPKAVDSWILYTREFYELVRDRLAEGGVMVQWLPLHGLSEREFKIIVATFRSAFPEMTLWANVGFETYGQVGYAKLVGIRGRPLSIDVAALDRRLDGTKVGADLAGYGMKGSSEILDLFVAGPEAIATWTRDLPVQTDDHPIVPYTTRYSLGRRMVPSLLLGVRESAVPWLRGATPVLLARAHEAQGLVISGRLARASEVYPEGGKLERFLEQTATTRPYYLALAERYAGDEERLFEAATQLAALGHAADAKPVYEAALVLEPESFRTRLDYANLLVRLGDNARALDLLIALREEEPGAAIVHHNLGVAAWAGGDAGAAAAHQETAVRLDGDFVGARLELARARLALGEIDRCEAEALAIVRINPWVADARDVLAAVELSRGRLAEAESHAATAVSLDPYRAEFLLRLGTIQRKRGRLEPAVETHEALLRIEPDHAIALYELGLSRAAQQRHGDAAELHARALEQRPDFVAAAFGLGLALRAENRDEQAIDAFCLVMRLSANHVEARAQLVELEASCR